jgi:hypothetical protein
LKKLASHFFNHAVGVTGEKEAANPVTGEKYNQVFNVSKSFGLFLWIVIRFVIARFYQFLLFSCRKLIFCFNQNIC